ncbi:MAG: adenylate/guanylate cyclase domain-containing protein [Gaiellaceae bacterium]
MSALRRLAKSFFGRVATIGADPRDNDEQRLRKSLLVVIAILNLPIAFIWGTLYLALGAPAGLIAYLYLLISAAATAIFWRTGDVRTFLRTELLAILCAPTLSMIFVGGFIESGGVGLWGILAPLGALVFDGVRAGVRWFAAFVVIFLGSGIVGDVTGGISNLPAWFQSTMIALNVTVGGTIVFTLLAIFARQREEALGELRVEQDKAESLLLNILPRSIAEKLKADTATIADQFEAASILFADVVDFTPLSERLRPAEVVGILDHLFSHFDGLADRYDVEKIKTIGDCYMVAAGVPSARPDHARVLALMALDMQAAMCSLDEIAQLGLQLRIGINSGPVVAGVIGRKRFLYDLWGDAVNTASRMESHGTSGRIQITRATKELLSDEFLYEHRGAIPVKGKGEIEAWYLVGHRSGAGAQTRADRDAALL